MAKVRVYELARDLNLDSKQLVQKLKDGGMSIKNYMSTLDEEAAAKARDIVAGRVSEIIEEKRVKPTVIRRRKKTVKIEPEKPALEPEEEAKKVEIELEKRPPVKMTKAAESVVQKVEEEIKKEEVRAKKRPVLKKKKEAPAKEVKKEVPAEVKTVKPVAKEKPKKKVKKGLWPRKSPRKR
jgi:translation initiation factor IF-2